MEVDNGQGGGVGNKDARRLEGWVSARAARARTPRPPVSIAPPLPPPPEGERKPNKNMRRDGVADPRLLCRGSDPPPSSVLPTVVNQRIGERAGIRKQGISTHNSSARVYRQAAGGEEIKQREGQRGLNDARASVCITFPAEVVNATQALLTRPEPYLRQ